MTGMSDTEWTAERIEATKRSLRGRKVPLCLAESLSLLDALESARESERSKNAELQLASEAVSRCSMELEGARAERDARSALIEHMWVHDGYEINGYWQMDAKQKALYSLITGYFPDAP